MSDAPIGVFDSGVGGLSVLRHIRSLLPHEELLYVADSAHAPYGDKTQEFIRERAINLADFLVAQGAKALVVACNTATAVAIEPLRRRYDLPIIGMEPAIKPAAVATKTGVIGVLATVGTLRSAQFAALLENHGKTIKVVTQAGHGLVECIERGELTTDKTRRLLQSYLKPLLKARADTIVLGCTHYPFVRPLIEDILRPEFTEITLIDTGAAVARQLHKRLAEQGLLSGRCEPAGETFWSNSLDAEAENVMTQLWGSVTSVSAA